MKKFLVTFLLSIFLTFGAFSNASAYLMDWNIDTSGGGNADGAGVIDVWTKFNITGLGYAEIYDVDIAIGDLVGTFSNWGVWNATSSDYGGETFPDINGDGTFDFELTGIYQFGGDVVLGGDLTFNTGSLNIYLDDRTHVNYGTINFGDNTVYGANDGTLIASFNLVSGNGVVSGNGEITQSMDNVNITYESTFLAPGYWITAGGEDLSTLDTISWLLGFSNTTAVTAAPQTTLIPEIYTEYALLNGATQGPAYNPPAAIYMINNGEFALEVVPEPTTMLLLGVGLLGLAGVSRKKWQNNK